MTTTEPATSAAAEDHRPGGHTARALGLAVAAAAVTAAADLASKTWALDTLAASSIDVLGPLSLTLGFNTGVAFGLGQAAPVLALVTIAAVISAALLVGVARRSLPALPAGLVLGGAVANVLDRLPDGRVTDFIDVGAWPTFNLADTAIVSGAVLIALLGGRMSRPAAA